MTNSSKSKESEGSDAPSSNFIRHIVAEDLANDRHAGRVHTRFPPEPNGYLHIGHAKSICLNFGIAAENNGQCNLRFDDTNPEKESQEFVDAIKDNINWLGFNWSGDVRYSSSYFEQLYQFGVQLIEKGLAYVCDLSADEAREFRGTLTDAGRNSPYRERSIAENLNLFARMREGEFADGACSLRAKIDMASPNINMRDPVLYRIRHIRHHQTGDAWCIYPTYDYTHCISDAIEGITHSLCTLEFEDHRPLYDWILNSLDLNSIKQASDLAESDLPYVLPKQTEFAKLKINYTVVGKRKLKQLVDEGLVQGWDDPRMPTLAGMRRRGYTAASLRNFCESVGVGAKVRSI
jgi:glutaminyl-tRNA synthetase